MHAWYTLNEEAGFEQVARDVCRLPISLKIFKLSCSFIWTEGFDSGKWDIANMFMNVTTQAPRDLD